MKKTKQQAFRWPRRVKARRCKPPRPCAHCDQRAVLIVGRTPLCVRRLSPLAKLTTVQRALVASRRRYRFELAGAIE